MDHIWTHCCSACDLMFLYFYLGLKLTRNNLVGITREILLLVVFIVLLLLLSTIFIKCFRDDLVSLCWLGNAIARHSLKGRAWGRHRSLTEKKNTSLVRPSRALAVPLGFSSLLLLFAELFLSFSLILKRNCLSGYLRRSLTGALVPADVRMTCTRRPTGH